MSNCCDADGGRWRSQEAAGFDPDIHSGLNEGNQSDCIPRIVSLTVPVNVK